MVQAYNYLFFILFDNVNTSILTLEEINSLIHGQKSETQYFVTSVDRALWNKLTMKYIYTHTSGRMS